MLTFGVVFLFLSLYFAYRSLVSLNTRTIEVQSESDEKTESDTRARDSAEYQNLAVREFNGNSPKINEILRRYQHLIWPGVVLFVYSCAPTATGQVASYNYTVFMNDQCTLVRLRLVGSAMTNVGCLLYAGLIAKHLSGILILCSFLHINVMLRPSTCHAPVIDADVLLGSSTMDYVTYSYLSTILTGIASAFSIIPLVVLATNHSPNGKRRGLFYSLYLSALDLGNSVSDWATTPIIKLLGIENFAFGHNLNNGLPLLIIICGFARLGTLILLYPIIACILKKRSEVPNDNELSSEQLSLTRENQESELPFVDENDEKLIEDFESKESILLSASSSDGNW
eukprot:CAMPEP_0167742462 /NCGR_PEP_ID=MMETSP0110_2-20121227/1446_1 /TAXON_ID=629695 /ORGANISM="Gymnochlora sp., Strain CCMP2014" /LENGTH=340 /DNA_ID=CAMNT_0007626669 /DNA_START=615 /DNA_END=1638 /DNA_ORIENTATION=-